MTCTLPTFNSECTLAVLIPDIVVDLAHIATAILGEYLGDHQAMDVAVRNHLVHSTGLLDFLVVV